MSPVEMDREDDQKPNANERLEQVFDTADETEALVVRGLLESNGIECMESTLDAPQDVLPGVGGIVLSVRERAFIRRARASDSGAAGCDLGWRRAPRSDDSLEWEIEWRDFPRGAEKPVPRLVGHG